MASKRTASRSFFSSWLWAGLLILCVGCVGANQPGSGALDVPTLNPLPGHTPLVSSVETETPAAAPAAPAAPLATAPSLPVSLPQAPPFPIPGIELDYADTRALELTVQAGAHWVRRNALNWAAVEPSQGQRDWAAVEGFEAELQAAAQHGLEQIVIVRGTPGWAQKTPGYPCSAVSEARITAFAQFLHDAVQRYSRAPYGVRYWEIGNEPDVDPAELPPESPFGCWGDSSDPFYGGGYYAQVLSQVYPAIKSADPDAQVLVGGLLMDCDPVNPPEGKNCKPAQYLEGVLRNGGAAFFDGISFHAYDYYSGYQEYGNPNWNSNWNSTGPVLTAKVRYIRSLLAAYQASGKFLINSEAGLLCPDLDDSPLCRSAEFELTKAAYAAQANTTALAEDLWANIWYSLGGWRGTALAERGVPNRAFRAYQFNAGFLAGASYARPLNEISDVRGYEFARGGKRLQVLWALDDQEHLYKSEQPPQAVFDLFGEPLSWTGGVRVARQPVYIEWGN